MTTVYFWCCGRFFPSLLKQISVRRRRIQDLSVLPPQAKLPLCTSQFHSRFLLYPDSWMKSFLVGLFVFWGILAEQSIDVPMCCCLQEVLSLHCTSWRHVGGIVGTHTSLIQTDLWGAQSCCATCSGKPGKLATKAVDVPQANKTPCLVTGIYCLLQLTATNWHCP